MSVDVCALHRVRFDGQAYNTLPADSTQWHLVKCTEENPCNYMRIMLKDEVEPEGTWADAMELMRTWMDDRFPVALYGEEMVVSRDEFLAATHARLTDECVHISGKPPVHCGVARSEHVGLMHSFMSKDGR